VLGSTVFFVNSKETAAALCCVFCYSTAGVKTTHSISLSLDCVAGISACLPYTTVYHQWSSFSDRRCSYLEHSAALCHIRTISAIFLTSPEGPHLPVFILLTFVAPVTWLCQSSLDSSINHANYLLTFHMLCQTF